MINWILAREDMVRFIRLKPKKQQQIIREKQNEVKAKQHLLMRRIREARTYAEQIAQIRAADPNDSEIGLQRGMMKEPIGGVMTLVNDYLRSLLWLQIHQVLAVEGVVLPSQLTALRDDIDFGFLDLAVFDDLEGILEQDHDPFADVEDDILRSFDLI
jgi:hypothetical protein